MSASAHLIQLCRAHYSGNESAFTSAAMTLARGLKVATTREAILDIIREGVSAQRQGRKANPTPAAPPPQMIVRSNGLLEELPRVTLESLQLEPELQLAIDELVVELEYREELAIRNLRARNRLLFFGPPGNGKTSVASALATALGLTAFAVSLPRLIESHVGGTGQNLGRLFENLTPNSVVVFDEIDAVASSRGDPDQAASKEFNSNVNTLLTLMDRNRGGVIIATTNRPDVVDPAVLRRFDEQLEFPGPRPDQIRSLADKLSDGFDIPRVSRDLLGDCLNYDAVAKVVEREARRIVMREILAAETADTETNDEEQHGEKEN
jgi:SpoVK/Ycf46/Vps4 family AAA+-type ATPase